MAAVIGAAVFGRFAGVESSSPEELEVAAASESPTPRPRPSRSPRPTPTPTPTPSPVGSWRELRPEPFTARYNAATLWTGTRLVVWGGQRGEWPARATLPGDGAIWDPGSRSWTRIPPIPLPARQSSAVAWAGGQLFIWGGSDAAGYRADGAMYDPSAGWSTLPPAPLSPRHGALAVAAGDEVLVIGGWDNLGVLNDAAAYNRHTRQWRAFPSLPKQYGESLRAADTPRGLLLWAQNSFAGYDGGTGTSPLRYDPRRGRWRPLLRAAGLNGSYASIAVVRGDLYALTANTPARVLVLRRGTQQWETVSTLREEGYWGQHLVAGGRYLYMVSITPALAAQRLDTRTLEWTPLARESTPWQELTTVAWTGDELVIRGLATDPDSAGATGLAPKLMRWRPER